MSSSVLTNTSAMIALQNLRSTNGSLAEVTNQISTGKAVATAKDNAAVFAIASVMESDVTGFEAVSDSLSLGQSTVAVASKSAESINKLLNEIKGKVIAANEDNVDRTKLQNEIVSLREQITSITSAAQFNGLNLIDGSNDGTGGFSVLSSIDRAADGSVTSNSISFDPTLTNLSTSSGTALVIGSAAVGGVVAANVVNIADQTGGAGATLTAAGNGQQVTLTASDGATDTDGIVIGDYDFQIGAGTFTGGTAAVSDATAGVDTAQTGGLLAGDALTLQIGEISTRYTIREGDTQADINAGLRAGLLEAGLDTDTVSVDVNATGQLVIDNQTANAVDVEMTVARASGGLAGLDTIDVSDAAGAQAALGRVEGFIQNTVDAMAQLGTIEKRLEIQGDFMSNLIDTFEAGIGGLVDADLEEASARLKALQTQQQLGVQALSIANAAPQSLLSLFR